MWGPNPLWCPLPWLSLPPPSQYYSGTELKDGPEELTGFKYWQGRAVISLRWPSFTHDLASKLADGKGLGNSLCGLRARSRQGQYLLSDAESEVLRHKPFDAALPLPDSWETPPRRFWALGHAEHPRAEAWVLWAPFWKHKRSENG